MSELVQDLELDLSPIFQAFEKEADRWSKKDNDSFRIFHGRGKCFPGLDWVNIDYHSSLVLITLYSSSSVSLNDHLIENLTREITHFIRSKDSAVDTLLVQRRDLYKAPISALIGEVPKRAHALRGGLKFGLSFGQQNVGYFLDIEPARVWLSERCGGKNLLNLFSYTCAFSVVATGAGASSVVNIDMSKKSLQRGRDNYAVNGLATSAVSFLPHDIFKSWGKLKKYGPYDIVIIDPPSFQKGSFIASKDYAKVIRRMASLVAEGGHFLACLNSPEVHLQDFQAMLDEHAPEFVFQQRLAPLESFPESEAGRELKMLVYQKN